MVKYTKNLMSHIHIFKCFLEIMFFSVFFTRVKAAFLSFNLVTKYHRYVIRNVSNRSLIDGYYSDTVLQIAIIFWIQSLFKVCKYSLSYSRYLDE